MAEGQKIGGYQCEFVGQVPEELLCKSCKLVAREPRVVDCCGEHFCQACIDPVLKDKKPCPSCGDTVSTALFIKKDLKKILALQVHCAMKQRGCEWVGQLEGIDAHLDTDCQYVDVECPSECDQKVQKHNVAYHLKEHCPKREYMCPHCNFKATFAIVSKIHWPECSYFPLRCPNECGVTCEREIMEDHMKICSLEEVKCTLSFAGCKEKYLQQDHDEHKKRNVERHLELLATATLRVNREFEQKLQDKDTETKQEITKLKDELKYNLQEKDQQIRELQESHKQVQQQLEEKDAEMKKALKNRDNELTIKLEEKDQQVRESAAEVTALKKQLQETDEKLTTAINVLHVPCVPPHNWTMKNFAEVKAKNSEWWHSEDFYTHPKGYHCKIGVCPSGEGEGYRTHVSVTLDLVDGEFDATLPWPAKATITLQLMNQHRDQDHVTVTKTFEWRKQIKTSFAGAFAWSFIPHAELGWNIEKQTQYLKNDSLRFRITEIQVYK